LAFGTPRGSRDPRLRTTAINDEAIRDVMLCGATADRRKTYIAEMAYYGCVYNKPDATPSGE